MSSQKDLSSEDFLMTEDIAFFIFAGDDTSVEAVYKTGHELQTTGLEFMKYTLYFCNRHTIAKI